MQVQQQITGEQAFQAFIQLARQSKLTADEHDQFKILTEIVSTDLLQLPKLREELEQLKAQHAKCTSQPGSANSPSGAMGSQGDGAHVGKDRGAVEPPVTVQKPVQ